MALLRLQSISTLTFPSLPLKPSKSRIAFCSRRPLNPCQHHQLQKHQQKLSAVAGEISAAEGDQSVIEDSLRQNEVVRYEWSEEWYPLYLTNNVPDDAPLGLTVFDKQVVLFRDGGGEIRCYEDRCPHRLAKLSEGQLIDGRLECLYHGWQFEGNGKCVKVPQLSEGAKIPASACVRTYEIKDSQGVIWIWMSRKTPPNLAKIPWFENFERPGFRDLSTIHELPYDHSILLENLMDPAHVPISHNRSDSTSKREEAGPLYFEVTERTGRGFAGRWGRERDVSLPNHIPNFLRFEAPCVLQSNREIIDEDGQKLYFSGLFLCRPSGQGKSMLIVRFGNTRKPSFLFKLLPQWYLHQTASKILEEDMGFLSSQNEILVRGKAPTRELYINLKTSDTWVAEYRRWMDKVGHGMPYHFGHSTVSLPENPALVEQAPAGFAASLSASQPAKGGVGTMHAPNPANRYFRHVVHCKGCRGVVRSSRAWKKALSVAAAVSTALAILASGRLWKVLFLLSTAVFLAGIQMCSTMIAMNTTNFIRRHRRL
ncbi:protein TIC 55, chloroplastic-like [Salvia miltiorrhiza]|uniref:protein TIC 55, chloroplastic-like n=1 Tax=Salvia miltiorrhiza TaxID=226208 RepID=UPI0025ACBE03|nr:protein TIC 55, chloroplastic-like [Salvia miltiorrhiza]